MSGRPKDILMGLEARRKLLSGALQAARVASTTHGPFGKTVLIQRLSGLVTTKDGLTVVRETCLPDPVENMGARIFRDACIKVNDEAGDGTTAAAILTAAMLTEGHKAIVGGMPADKVVADIAVACDAACTFVRGLAIPVSGRDAIEWIAETAGNGDKEIARLMADACMAVGKDGVVAVEDGKGVASALEFKEGMEIGKGAASQTFLAGAAERVAEGALVAVIAQPLRLTEDVKDLLETASQWPQNELVVFSPSVLGDALRTMTLNDSKGVVRCVAIQAPGHRTRDFLEDVAALSGAVLVDTGAGMPERTWNSEWFGKLRKATIKSGSSFLEAYDENSESVKAHVAKLKSERERTSSDFEKDTLNQRIAKLSGGLAVLKIGGATEAALKERRARVEDVLGAVRASLRGGVVPGGGVACFRAAKVSGNGIVAKALAAPLRSLARNAGLHWTSIIPAEGSDPWSGWDFVQGRMRTLSDAPLVADAAPAVESGIRAACSVARTLLATDVAVTFGPAPGNQKRKFRP